MTENINVCYNINCVDFMRDCSPCFFDCIITDPPYDVDFNNKIKALAELRNYKEYEYAELTEDYNLLSKLFWKVLKNNTYCIIFCSDLQSYKWINEMHKIGFVACQFLIWQKESGVFAMSPYVTTILHEIAIVFRKGQPSPLNNSLKGKGSIIKVSRVKDRFHPAQKPLELLERIINLYTKENDLIYDAFAGSGSTLKAGISLKRKVIGTELLKNYSDKINHDLKSVEILISENQKVITL